MEVLTITKEGHEQVLEIHSGLITGPRGNTGSPAGFDTPTASVTQLSADQNPTVSVTSSGPDTNKQFDFQFGIPVSGVVQADWNQTDTTADDYIENKPDLTLKEDKSNKVTSISDQSTNTQYPSAKAVHDTIDNVSQTLLNTIATKQDKSNLVTSISDQSTDIQYPSAKCVYDSIEAAKPDDYDISDILLGANDDVTFCIRKNGTLCRNEEFSIYFYFSGPSSNGDRGWISVTTDNNGKISNLGSITSEYTTNWINNNSNISTLTISIGKGNGLYWLCGFTVTRNLQTTEITYNSGKAITSGAVYDYAEDKSNKVTSISSSSTDTQYPSAKAVYTEVNNLSTTKENKSNKVTSISASSTDIQYPSAKAVWTHLDSLYDYDNYLTGNKEDKSNKVTSISSDSTDTQYPSAKCVYDAIESAKSDIYEITDIKLGYNDTVTFTVRKNGVACANEDFGLRLTFSGPGLVYRESTPTHIITDSNGQFAIPDNGTWENYETYWIQNSARSTTSSLDLEIIGEDVDFLCSANVTRNLIATTITQNVSYPPTGDMVVNYAEDKLNKVTSISASSTDTQYPSAKCVYDAIHNLAPQEQADWNESDSSAVDYIKNKPTNVSAFTNDAGYVTASQVPAAQVNSDWNAVSGVSQILNKPDLTLKEDKSNKVTSISSGSTDTQYPSAKCVYDAIQAIPSQVQSDWNQTDNTAPDYIKNKPSSTLQEQADWTETNTLDPSYIRNKPDLTLKEDKSNKTTSISASSTNNQYPTAAAVYNAIQNIPVIVGTQSDWTETDNSEPSYIKHKPDLTLKEDKSNKVTSIGSGSTDTQYPSALATKTYTDNRINSLDYTDNVQGDYVTSVSESNGIISVTKDNIQNSIPFDSPAGRQPPSASAVQVFVNSLVEGGYSDCIRYTDNSIGALDYTDTPTDMTYVYSVSENNGKISVTRGSKGLIASGDYNLVDGNTVYNSMVSYFELAEEDAQTYTNNKVNTLDYTDNVQGDYVTSVSETNGIVSLTKGSKGTITSGSTGLVDGGTVYTALQNLPVYTQVQSDWSETDTTDPSYIENKPDFYEITDLIIENIDNRLSFKIRKNGEGWGNQTIYLKHNFQGVGGGYNTGCTITTDADGSITHTMLSNASSDYVHCWINGRNAYSCVYLEVKTASNGEYLCSTTVTRNLVTSSIDTSGVNYGKNPSNQAVYNFAEAKANKVTSIDDQSTDAEYPSAKCVYDAIQSSVAEKFVENSTVYTAYSSPITLSSSNYEKGITYIFHFYISDNGTSGTKTYFDISSSDTTSLWKIEQTGYSYSSAQGEYSPTAVTTRVISRVTGTRLHYATSFVQNYETSPLYYTFMVTRMT